MPDPQRMIGKSDLVLVPQYATEGTTPSDIAGQTAAAATMYAPLQKGYLERDNQPEFEENEFGGYLDRRGHYKTWEENMAMLKGRLLATILSLNMLKWGMNADATNTKGPDESRTFLYSYKDIEDQEIFCIFKGCKPASCTVSLSKQPGATIDLSMKAKYAHEAVKPTNAAGWNAVGFAGAPTKTLRYEDSAIPLRFADLGDLLYKPVPAAAADHSITVGYTNLAWRSFTATVAWKFRKQDSNGSDRDVNYDYAGRDVSGSADMFKRGHLLNEDAKAGSLHVAVIQLEKSTSAKRDTHASIAISGVLGSNNHLAMVALVPGALGNGVKLTASIGATGVTTTSVDWVRGRHIHVIIKHGGDTFANVAAAVNGHDEASKLAALVAVGNGNVSAAIPESSARLTANGTDAVRKIIFERFRWEPSNENLIDATDDATIESKSFRADGCTVVIP